MKKQMLTLAALIALTSPALARDEEAPRSSSEAVAKTKEHPSPNAIVDAAKAAEWVQIPAEDLLVMTLAPDSDGASREVVIQLMPAPFSQGWVSNIRTLARAKWYDGITVNRVQDNYVVQWGDANGEDPEKAKPLPEGLKVMDEGDYVFPFSALLKGTIYGVTASSRVSSLNHLLDGNRFPSPDKTLEEIAATMRTLRGDGYANDTYVIDGWPVAVNGNRDGDPILSPTHCYGMVGVGRSYSPDTGSGAELYTVIGHAPRHLDRNIALVGRIISGMEHLSSMKRGSGELGFYTEDEAGLRTPIQSIRVVGDMPAEGQTKYEYLSTESETFAKYAEARANRRDPFFITPAGGADICNIPVPVRQTAND